MKTAFKFIYLRYPTPGEKSCYDLGDDDCEDDELVASVVTYSDAGFITTTYRMRVEEVDSVWMTHAEWLVDARRVQGCGRPHVVRHFDLPDGQ